MDPLESELYRDGLFDFTRSYFAAHPAQLPNNWMPDAAVLQDLRDFLARKGQQFSEAQFGADHDWIERNLAREMYTTAFNVDVASQMFERNDPEVHKAAESMPQAAALLDSAKKTLVQRGGKQPSRSEAAAVK